MIEFAPRGKLPKRLAEVPEAYFVHLEGRFQAPEDLQGPAPEPMILQDAHARVVASEEGSSVLLSLLDPKQTGRWGLGMWTQQFQAGTNLTSSLSICF